MNAWTRVLAASCVNDLSTVSTVPVNRWYLHIRETLIADLVS